MLKRLLASALLASVLIVTEAARYDKFLYHEVVTIEFHPVDFHQVHKQYEFWFEAFNRTFHILVTPHSWKMRNVIVYNSGIETHHIENLSRHKYVEGTITEESNSVVYGILDVDKERQAESFKGVILTKETMFFLEPEEDYFPGNDSHRTLIYRDEDLRDEKCLQEDKMNCGEKIFERESHVRGQTSDELSRIQISDIDDAKNKSCIVEISADSRFMAKHKGNKDRAISEIYLVLNFIENLFRKTDFDNDGKSDNIGINADKITIYQNDSDIFPEPEPGKDKAVEFLYNCAKLNSNYCLSICFSHDDWNGTLGLSEIPSANKPYDSGICATSRKENGVDVNSNALVVSSYGSTLMKFILSTSHEIGHAFGAHHDPKTKECYSSSRMGHYIMGENMNEYSKGPNTRKFSNCSKADIVEILSSQSKCLKAFKNAYCGNALVEEGEECDCGMAEVCQSVDPCCRPPGPDGCTLRARSNCSYVANSDCCTKECDFAPAKQPCGILLNLENCVMQPYCFGNSSECYYPGLAPDGARCGSNREQTCRNGSCISNVCADRGLLTCQCTIDEFKCERCCSKSAQRCVPASADGFDRIYLGFGHPCSFYQGYCDRNGTCIPRQIKYFEPTEYWLSRNWSYILNIILFVILLLLLITVLYFYHLPAAARPSHK